MTSNRLTPRAFLAKELQHAREAKGINRGGLAQEIYVSESLVRAWESGRRIPQPDHLAKVEELLGIGGIFSRMREDLVRDEPLPEWLGRWREIEEQATSLLIYQPVLVPGLLQTADYARAVLAASGRGFDDVVDRVQARLERQKVLAPEHGLMFVALIDEGVLHRPVGGPAVMWEQIDKIIQTAEQPNVMVQVVPLSAGAHPGLSGGFVIAAMDGQEYAYVDDAFSGDVIELADDVAIIKRLWETLRAEALPAGQSSDLMAEAMERWAT